MSRLEHGAAPGDPSIPFPPGAPYPARSGNAVRLLLDGEPAFRRVCEAIDAAQTHVWATITFMWPGFEMPDGRGSPLDVLEGAARRGVDVRLLFWRPDDETAGLRPNAFWGSPEQVERLRARAPSLHVRWDRAQPGFCQHQKTWLTDAGADDAAAFVGGLNLNPHSLALPGHRGEGQNHDLYIELRGPAVADVQHNFVQRWNEASERWAGDGHWKAPPGDQLPFPTRLPPEYGSATVQVQRTVHAGRLHDGHAPVGGAAFAVAAGERTIFEQYLSAIGAAHRTIYLENQYLEVLEVVEALQAALRRGVEVAVVLPAEPVVVPGAQMTSERQTFLAARAALGRAANFTLCGLAGPRADGRRTPVYVHAKLMLVDDAWATVGSANLHRWSLFGNAELNTTVASRDTVRALRTELFGEHLGVDTAHLDDLDALRLFREVAHANGQRRTRGGTDWQGLVFSLDVATYGQVSQVEDFHRQG